MFHPSPAQKPSDLALCRTGLIGQTSREEPVDGESRLSPTQTCLPQCTTLAGLVKPKAGVWAQLERAARRPTANARRYGWWRDAP